LRTGTDETVSWIADARSSGIADKRHIQSALYFLDDLGRPLLFIMFVVTEEGRLDCIVRQKFTAVACILCENKVNTFEGVNSPQGDIL
jgi:hypothetical protein